MPDDLHHLPRPPPSPETSTAKARALSKTWRLLLPPPSPPRHRDARHTAPPPPDAHRQRGGDDKHVDPANRKYSDRIRYSTNADPRCRKPLALRPTSPTRPRCGTLMLPSD